MEFWGDDVRTDQPDDTTTEPRERTVKRSPTAIVAVVELVTFGFIKLESVLL